MHHFTFTSSGISDAMLIELKSSSVRTGSSRHSVRFQPSMQVIQVPSHLDVLVQHQTQGKANGLLSFNLTLRTTAHILSSFLPPLAQDHHRQPGTVPEKHDMMNLSV
jgi:hypothetical protein